MKKQLLTCTILIITCSFGYSQNNKKYRESNLTNPILQEKSIQSSKKYISPVRINNPTDNTIYIEYNSKTQNNNCWYLNIDDSFEKEKNYFYMSELGPHEERTLYTTLVAGEGIFDDCAMGYAWMTLNFYGNNVKRQQISLTSENGVQQTEIRLGNNKGTKKAITRFTEYGFIIEVKNDEYQLFATKPLN